MINIEIGNVYCKMLNAPPKVLTLIDSTLSVAVQGASFSNSYRMGAWDGKKHFFSVATKKFPAGLLYKVIKVLSSNQLPYELKDVRNIPSKEIWVNPQIHLLDKNVGSITLREYQQKAVERAIENCRGIINVATNGGKTEIACGILQALLPVLPQGMTINFFTHSIEIFEQTKNRIEQRLGIEVGMVGSGKWDLKDINVIIIPSINRYTKKPKNLPLAKKYKDFLFAIEQYKKKATFLGRPIVELEGYKEAKEELEEYEKTKWKELNAKVKATKALLDSCFCFIADEAHHSPSSTWYETFMKLDNAPYRIGLTGTVDTSDPENLLKLCGCTGPIISKISNDYLIKEGYSAKPTIHMLDMGLCNPIVNEPYEVVRKVGIVNNEYRNKVMITKVIEQVNKGNYCLIIVNEKEHGDILLDIIKKNTTIWASFIHGSKTNTERQSALENFKDQDLQVLIATSILDEGVDVSGINCVFLAGGGKSMRMILQRIGRGLRKKEGDNQLIVYDFLDRFNEFLENHSEERLRVYKEEQFDIITEK